MPCPLQRNGCREPCNTPTNNADLEWTLACHHIIDILCLVVSWSCLEEIEVASAALARGRIGPFTLTLMLTFVFERIIAWCGTLGHDRVPCYKYAWLISFADIMTPCGYGWKVRPAPSHPLDGPPSTESEVQGKVVEWDQVTRYPAGAHEVGMIAWIRGRR